MGSKTRKTIFSEAKVNDVSTTISPNMKAGNPNEDTIPFAIGKNKSVPVYLLSHSSASLLVGGNSLS
jgi:hypothetical protein